MPRFGKKFKMFEKIVPSLELDVTDLLDQGRPWTHLEVLTLEVMTVCVCVCVQVFSSASCVEGWQWKSAPTVSQSLSSARRVSSSSARLARLRCSPSGCGYESQVFVERIGPFGLV